MHLDERQPGRFCWQMRTVYSPDAGKLVGKYTSPMEHMGSMQCLASVRVQVHIQIMYTISVHAKCVSVYISIYNKSQEFRSIHRYGAFTATSPGIEPENDEKCSSAFRGILTILTVPGVHHFDAEILLSFPKKWAWLGFYAMKC